jgi:uncharacterized protein YjbI with pentapeptide repeats
MPPVRPLQEQISQGQGFIVPISGAALLFSASSHHSLSDTDFSSALLTGASLEDTLLSGAHFTGAVLAQAYLSYSLTDVMDITGADFSDALMTDFTRQRLCARVDASGVNQATGVSTRDSLLCD